MLNICCPCKYFWATLACGFVKYFLNFPLLQVIWSESITQPEISDRLVYTVHADLAISLWGSSLSDLYLIRNHNITYHILVRCACHCCIIMRLKCMKSPIYWFAIHSLGSRLTEYYTQINWDRVLWLHTSKWFIGFSTGLF